MASDLYLLPPQILPMEHINTPNLRYFNSDFASLQHPFGKAFDIESHNIAWFDDKPPSRIPDFLNDNSLPDITICKAKPLSKHYPLNTSSNKPVEPITPPTQSVSPPIPATSPTTDTALTDTNFLPSPSLQPSTLLSKIINSSDKLFFIQFTPAHTMKPKWFLVEVDLSSDDNDPPDPSPSTTFFCTFLQRHPCDSG